jgi:hypothetical protein
MKDTKHLWRIFLLIIIGIAVFLVGRILLVPKTFGAFGHYRGADVAEQMSLPVKHQGPASCEPCHTDEFNLWKSAAHHDIVCENCHAPVITHIKDDEKIADMEINRSTDFCLRCHQKLPARPVTFPQINAPEHLAERKMALQDTVCLMCHGPHDPTPKDSDVTQAMGKAVKE